MNKTKNAPFSQKMNGVGASLMPVGAKVSERRRGQEVNGRTDVATATDQSVDHVLRRAFVEPTLLYIVSDE